jgi:hypothetical protein
MLPFIWIIKTILLFRVNVPGSLKNEAIVHPDRPYRDTNKALK